MGWVVLLGLGLLLLGGTFLFGEQLSESQLDLPPYTFGGIGYPEPPERLQRVELDGPDGSTTFPTGSVCVVHVWRDGCEDCAQAFEFAEKLEVGGDRWGVPVHNVAFGPARLDTARARGLDGRLVYDPVGTAIVRPLRIGTFTTLVLDAGGYVRHRDHPQMDGYVSRVSKAVIAAANEHSARLAPRGGMSSRIGSGCPWERILFASGGLFTLGGVAWGVASRPARRRSGPLPIRKLGQELALQAGQRCPYCHAGVGGFDWCVRCDGCGATYHEECGRDLGVCSALGCGRAVGTAT